MPITSDPIPYNVDDLRSGDFTDFEERERQVKAFNQQMEELLKFGVPAAAIGAVDTVLQSITPDTFIDDESIGNYVESLSQPLGQFYNENREGSQTVGEIVSSFVPIIGATKLIRAGSILERAATKTKLGKKYGDWVFATGKTKKDFIEQIDQEAKLFVKNKGLSVNEFGEQSIDKVFRASKSTAAKDMLKESLAADASIALFYNESDMFFPEELSTLSNIALFAVPDALLTGLAYRFTGTTIKRHLQQKWSEDLARAVNPFEAAGTKSVSLPGMRGPEAAHHAVLINTAKKDQLEIGNPELVQSANQRATAHRSMLVEEIINMGKDDPFGHGITTSTKYTADAGEVKNVRLAAENDPSLIVGVQSVEPLTAKSQVQLPHNLENRIGSLETELHGLHTEIKLADEGVVVENLEAKIKQFDELSIKLEELKRIRSMTVLEMDQSITPLADRRFSVLDQQDKLTDGIKEITEVGTKMSTLKQAIHNELNTEIAVSQFGKVLLKPVAIEKKNTVLGGVNLTQVISTARESVQQERANMKLLLRDMSKDWHYKNGSRGNNVFRQLPKEIKEEISNWTGSSGSSKLREWFKTNDPKAHQLLKAYDDAGLHRRLHEVADEDGTITLWRGERKAETKNPTNDVVSMAASPDIAIGFAGGLSSKNVIKRRVPVEDVIMIVGGLGDEAEYIVKGNLRRNKQALGSAVDEAVGIQSWDQRMWTWGLMQDQLDKFKPSGQPIFIHGESSMMELHFAYQAMKKFPDQNVVSIVKGGKGSQGDVKRELEWRLLQASFMEYQKLRAVQNAQKSGILKLSADQTLSDYDLARMVNLPNPTVGGKHPLMQVFDEIVPEVGGEIRDLRTFFNSLGEFEAAMARHVNPGRMGEELVNDLKFTGASLMHNRNPDLKPAILISTERQNQRISQEQVAQRMTANKLWQNSLIEQVRTDPELAQQLPIHRIIYDEMFSRGDALELAGRPDFIIEGLAKNRGIFGQQSEVFSDTPVVQALDRLKSLADRRVLEEVNKVFRGPDGAYTQTFNKILSANNAASLDTFNIAVNSLQQGWRLMPEPHQLDNGLWGFVLDLADPFNHQQYDKLFGINLAKLAEQEDVVLMPVRASVKQASGEVPVAAAVDDLALDTLRAIEEIEFKFLDELNFDRKLQKLAPINKKPWHIPVTNLQQGYTVYLADSGGHLQSLINRPTKAEALRVAKQEVDAAAKDGRNWIAVDEFTVRTYHETMGEIWENPKNFSLPQFQTGTTKGKLGTRTIQFGKGPLDTILSQQQRNYEMLTRNAFATMFESELNYTRSHILADTLGDEAARRTKSQLHQQYERVILGKSALNPNGMVGKFYYAVESVADDFFRAAWDKLHAVKKPTAHTLEPEFARLNQKLGNYNPFKSSLEMLEANENIRVPPTMRKAVTKWNSFTTDMVLRILDMGMPIINFASLASVTPSVVAAMRRMPDETYDAWVRRTGIIGTPIDEEFIMPNTTRMTMEGMNFFFSPEAQRIRKIAAERGYIKQEVAERLNLWTSPHKGWMARNRDIVIDKLSWPTDRSEEMSRDIAFGMMFGIAKKTFQLDEEAAMLFAHTHANKIIGDFRPTNRPQMFQGAAGMPLGLFTTWAINWLQRVFGDIEAGRAGAVFWQAAMQQFLFGANSMPGVQQFVETFTTTYDGRGNAVDALDNMYGREFTDWFMNGTLASLTGIGFGSRADVSMPAVFSGESLTTAVPGVNVMMTLGEGLSEMVKSMRQQGLDPDAIGEIISVYGVNGFLRNSMQILQNTSVDRHGATIENEIRTFENIIPRMMELKSLREIKKSKELQRDRIQQQTERAHMDRLSKQLRTAVRAGDVDGELIESALMDYYKAGGNPTHFKRFLREQILTASFEKSSRLLLQAIRASDEQGKMARLMRITDDDLMR